MHILSCRVLAYSFWGLIVLFTWFSKGIKKWQTWCGTSCIYQHVEHPSAIHYNYNYVNAVWTSIKQKSNHIPAAAHLGAAPALPSFHTTGNFKHIYVPVMQQNMCDLIWRTRARAPNCENNWRHVFSTRSVRCWAQSYTKVGGENSALTP